MLAAMEGVSPLLHIPLAPDHARCILPQPDPLWVTNNAHLFGTLHGQWISSTALTGRQAAVCAPHSCTRLCYGAKATL